MKYLIKRSKRKTIVITVNRDLTVIVKAPLNQSDEYIDKLVMKNSAWIEKQQNIHRQNACHSPPLTSEDIENLKIKAKSVMIQKTIKWSKIMNVEPLSIKITSAKTRWGSCSGRNAICYSYRCMLLSDKRQDYIVIHELSHIKCKNHGKDFYKEIEKYMPDYKSIETEIKRFSNFDLYS